MGIIIRQSIKQSVVSYTAILVAAFAQFFIYTLDDLETYGRAQKMLAIVLLFYPIMSFGLPQAAIKFFGLFSKDGRGYLLNFILLSVCSFLSFGVVLYLFREPLLSYMEYLDIQVILFENYWFLLALAILTLMIFRIIVSHMANYKRIVWPAIFDTLWTKFALALLVFMIIRGYLDSSWLEPGITIYFLIGLIAILGYTAFLGKLDLRFNRKVFKQENLTKIGSFAGYTGLAIFGGTLATRIDAFMAASFVDNQMMGVYVWFVFLCSIIDTPARAVANISSPIISQAIDRDDYTEVRTVYSKSTITLFLAGIGIYALIFLSLEDLIDWIGKADLLGPYFMIFGIIGLVRVWQSTFVISTQIILYSKYYRYLLYLTLFMGLINIVLNYIFITDIFVDQKLFGICYATAISISVHYTIVLMIIWSKFDIHPFSWNLLIGICLVMVCFAVAYYTPMTQLSLVNIALRSVLFGLPFLYLIYRFRLSPDINSIIDLAIEKIKNRDFKNLI